MFSFPKSPQEESTLSFEAISTSTPWARNALYSIIWLAEGNCLCRNGRVHHEVRAPALIFTTPFQDLELLAGEAPFAGKRIRFHGDFYCIEQHKAEVACNGILFNNVYAVPFVALDEQGALQVARYLDLLEEDFHHVDRSGWHEMVIAHLQIILILATRLKLREMELSDDGLPTAAQPTILQFRSLIEAHFRAWHKPSHYAAALGVSGNALGKLTKRHLLRSPTELILERLLLEAKRLLHFTTMSVKEIAFQLGFTDFGYFGRVFRKHCGISPTEYRRRVGIVLLG